MDEKLKYLRWHVHMQERGLIPRRLPYTISHHQTYFKTKTNATVYVLIGSIG